MLLIDAHLDHAMNAMVYDRDLTKSVHEIRDFEKKLKTQGALLRMPEKTAGTNTVALPEMRKGEVFICLATILTTVRNHTPPPGSGWTYCTKEQAYALANGQHAYYRILESQGHIRMIQDRKGLDIHVEEWRSLPDSAPLGFILAMEGADPIINPEQIRYWWDVGLRALGITHYDENDYAFGTGVVGGLKPWGYQLLESMEDIGIILDVTHLSEDSFWDAIDAFKGEIIASHNNCRALVQGVRQFSDDQIRALVERDGVISVALDNWMLHDGWVFGETPEDAVSLENVVDHIDHMCEVAGDTDHAAIGSDLDGGYGKEQSPRDIETIADLQKIPRIMEKRDYSEKEVEKIMYGNLLRKFKKALP